MAFCGNWQWNSARAKGNDQNTCEEEDDDRYRIIEDDDRPGQYKDGFGNHYDSNYNRID